MKIVNFISNFFINNHLLKLDINTDIVQLVLIVALIYSGLLFIFGLFIRKFSILYALLQLIYSTLNTTIILFICGLLMYLFGNVGFVIFSILLFIFLMVCVWCALEDESLYAFGIGNIPEWICDNYEVKQKFFTELNNEYNDFKQYNQEII